MNPATTEIERDAGDHRGAPRVEEEVDDEDGEDSPEDHSVTLASSIDSRMKRESSLMMNRKQVCSSFIFSIHLEDAIATATVFYACSSD